MASVWGPTWKIMQHMQSPGFHCRPRRVLLLVGKAQLAGCLKVWVNGPLEWVATIQWLCARCRSGHCLQDQCERCDTKLVRSTQLLSRLEIRQLCAVFWLYCFINLQVAATMWMSDSNETDELGAMSSACWYLVSFQIETVLSLPVWLGQGSFFCYLEAQSLKRSIK